MARPLNKEELILFAEKEYTLLVQQIALLNPEQRDKEFIFDNRTAKDLIAHVFAWQLLELGWYSEGMKGNKPQIPAPGYTFKDAPALNEKLFQEYKSISWDELEKKFSESHKQILNLVKSHTQEELYTKKKYAWTGSTDMASYFRSALSSHYMWATKLIHQRFK